MADPFRAGASVNVGLGVAVAILLGCAGLLALGPGRQHLQQLRGELSEKRERLEAWTGESAAFQGISRQERARWRAAWQGLLGRIGLRGDAPELTAQVGRFFRGASVRQLEVERGRAEDPEEEPHRLRAPDPLGAGRAVVEPIPIAVSFRSSYRDAFQLLSGLEARQLPARIERLEMSRNAPGVAVRLELTWFSRLPEGANEEGSG